MKTSVIARLFHSGSLVRSLCVAALMQLPFSGAYATVFVDLDFSLNTAANSGTFGDGTVTGTDASWENRNTTGYPVGRAFNTGANGMGSGASSTSQVGTISWSDASSSSMDGLSSFTYYMWIKSDSAIGGSARLLNDGSSLSVYLGTNAINVSINGTVATAWPYDIQLTDKWIFVAVTYDGSDNGTVSISCASAERTALSSRTVATGQTSLSSNTSDLVLLNLNNSDKVRPYDGELGTVYLSDEVLSASAIESIYSTTKADYIAVVPESSAYPVVMAVLMALNLVGLRAASRRRRKM